jgi:hypothetical protein
MNMLHRSGLVCLLLLAAPGCDGGPAPAGDDGGVAEGVVGVPDPDHAPPTDDDIDGDGVPNDTDLCPSLANADQRDICMYENTPPEPTGEVGADAVARLNYWRLQLGLEPVTEDPSQSHGCQVHLEYLQQLSAELGSPQLTHDEDLSKPYASEEGNQAGMDSVLSLGPEDIDAAIDGWLNTLYHRLALIQPGLSTIGVAYAEDGRYACLQYRPGTDSSVDAPHPIMWPAPDILQTAQTFNGNESPCPTTDDPFGSPCPGGAAIASLGLNGWGTISDATGSITRLDTMEEVPLIHVYFDGGPTEHEQMGYLQGSIALIPEPGTMLARAPYEVRVDASLDGTPTTWRWRFQTHGAFDDDIACELWDQGTFEDAIEVTPANIDGKICDQSDFFHIRDGGSYAVTLNYDARRYDLDLYIYDSAHTPITEATGPDAPHRIERVPGQSYIEVRGADGAMGPYSLSIEAN